MAQTTPNMSLTVWNQSSDPYDYSQLAQNFINIDQHDHSPGNGPLIDGSSGIKPGTIGAAQLGPNSVSAGNIVDGSVGNAELGLGAVTTDKISTNTGLRIQTNNIEDGAITSTKVATNIFQNFANLTNNLPATGSYDGYIVDYTDSTSTPAYVWRLRWNAATSKWYFVGGTPLYTKSTSLFSINASTFPLGGLQTGQFSTTVPFKGTYQINYSVTANQDSNVTQQYPNGYGYATTIYQGSTAILESQANAALVQNTTPNVQGSEAATVNNFFQTTIASTDERTLKIAMIKTEGAGNLVSKSGDQKFCITPVSIPGI